MAWLKVHYQGPNSFLESESDECTETSKLAINNGGEYDNRDITNAVARIRGEADRAIAYGNRATRDVTDEFRTASSQLLPGQLVKDEYFTLFESVGALEVS